MADRQLELDLAVTQWQREVDEETIDLIEAGVPPPQAAIKAVEVISSRRRAKYADKSGS